VDAAFAEAPLKAKVLAAGEARLRNVLPVLAPLLAAPRRAPAAPSAARLLAPALAVAAAAAGVLLLALARRR